MSNTMRPRVRAVVHLVYDRETLDDRNLMEGKGMKKGLIIKTWERCKSMGRGGRTPPPHGMGPKSMSWHGGNSDQGHRRTIRRKQVAPEGCFSVYVGPERQKFMVKAEDANHPLFRVLLEEAETEYGYSSAGPIELPCHVDVFYRVLVEMDSDDRIGGKRHGGCGFVHGCVGAYRLLSPSRLILNQF